MRSLLKMHVVDLFLAGVVIGFAAQRRAHLWLSWRRVERELQHIGEDGPR